MADEVVHGVPFPTSAFAYDQTLVKAKRNEVFDLVRRSGFDPMQFTWDQVPSSHHRSDVGVSKLTHSSRYYFLFNSTRDGHLFFSRSPGRNSRVDEGESSNWADQLADVQIWLDLLRPEVEEPDLWEAVKNENAFIEAAAGERENEPFSAEDQTRIAESIEAVRRLLTENLALNTQQISFLSQQLQYLVDASGRLGKKDWIQLTVSTLVTISVALSLNTDTTRELFRLAGEVFQWLLVKRLAFPIL